MEKAWLILDGRAWSDPDAAICYEAFSEEEGDTLESVKAERKRTWEDGVIFEYDLLEVKGGTLKGKKQDYTMMINQTLIG